MPASWLEEQREIALKAFEAEEVPTWRRSGFWTTSLRGLDLDALEARRYEPLADGDALPPTVAEDIGDSELGGLIVQRGATTIRSWIDPEVEAQGVIVCSLEEAVDKHPDEVREFYGKRLDPSEGKFTAASLAFWTGGAFVWVPKDVKVEKPIQIVYLIDEPGTAQYAQTLVVIGEHSQASIREYDLGTPFEGQALHAGGFELFARTGARADVAHFQDWGPAEVYDISTKRVEVGRDAFVSWVPIHLGGRLTKQTLDIITAEKGSDMRHTGMYFTEGEEHLDLFTTDRHEAGHTGGDTVWKGALTGSSRASYEGLIEIIENCQETHTYLQTHQMLLSSKAKGDAIPSLIVKTDSVSASHGGTVGELDEEQIFYMMTRGISRSEAVRVLVEGYFEEVVQRLHDEQLEALVRRRIAQKLLAAEDQVNEFIGERVSLEEAEGAQAP
ncbi:MAG TPA: SufD family Fe-S cluster assembly protein [Thermoleophilaceae bacterium]|nr:SufD family Fe-S cluster assembly protein [Thermoleophilaceae bacterium]